MPLLPLQSSSTFHTLTRKKFHLKVNLATLLVLVSVTLLCIQFMPRNKCPVTKDIEKKKERFRLIIIVLSSPDNLERRAVIRKTWLQYKHATVKHLFVIGSLDLLPEQRDTLESEKHKFNDLLLLPRLTDSYGTLTKKVLYALKETTDKYDFDFLLKCDDDTFVLVHKILKELEHWESKGSRKELYWGFFNGKAHVKRSGAWKETEWILCDYYLPYALGGGYVLSFNLVKFITSNMEMLKLLRAEDVSVGLWLAPLANIERKHDVRFDTEYRSRGCSNQYIVTHKQTVENMRNLHEYYEASGALCSKEVQHRMSYHYNWTVPPSQCCNPQANIP